MMANTDALIVVDVQSDFCSGGALAVPGGDAIIEAINRLQEIFETVVFTRDWHPPDHCSFSPEPRFVDGSWPAHCLAETPGAAFHPLLKVPPGALIISKGTRAEAEAYSGLDGTTLADALRTRGATRVFVCGLATDYCVKHTALDACAAGFDTVLIEDACRGVDIPPGSVAAALAEMATAGVTRVLSTELS